MSRIRHSAVHQSSALFSAAVLAIALSASARAQIIQPGDVVVVSEVVPDSLRVYDGCSGSLKHVFTDPRWTPSGAGRYVDVAPDGTLWVGDVSSKWMYQYDLNLAPLAAFHVTFPCVQPPTPSDQMRGFAFDPAGSLYIVGDFQSGSIRPLVRVDPSTGVVLACFSLGFPPVDADWLPNGMLGVSTWGGGGAGLFIVDPGSGATVQPIGCGGSLSSNTLSVEGLSSGLVLVHDFTGRQIVALDPSAPAGSECVWSITPVADSYPYVMGLGVNEPRGRLYTMALRGGTYWLEQYDLTTHALLASTSMNPSTGPALAPPHGLVVVPGGSCGASTSFCSLENISQTTCDDRAPELVVGPSGTSHAVFFYDNSSGGRGRMYYTCRLSGQAWWSLPMFVADNASHVTSIALGPNEVPFITYCEGSDGSERVKRLQGGSFVDFGTPLASGDFWKGGMGGQVAIDAQGKVFVAYFYGQSEDAHLAEWVGGAWMITPVSTTYRVGKGMKLALTSTGRPVLAYLDQDHSVTEVAERLPGGTWSIVSRGSGDPSDVAVLPNDDLVLVHRGNNQGFPAWVDFRMNGTWSNDPSFPGTPYNFGRVSVDSGGGVHMVASDWAGRLDYLHRPSGGTWQTSPIASGAAGGRIADIALSSFGDPLVVFTRIQDQMFVLASNACATTVYCTAGTTTNGCVPAIGSSGVPSATATSGFTLLASGIEGQQNGLFFYGVAPTATPWHVNSSSLRCVVPPLERTPVQNSAGTAGGCDGTFALDWNAWRAAHPTALGAPFVPCDVFYAQAWFRDPPAARNTNLSDALRFTLGP